MNQFSIVDTSISGLKLVKRQIRNDRRGSLSRIFCADDLSELGWKLPIAQINHTCTVKAGTVRGMHYQIPPHAEMKLVSCIRGRVWDVAVDLRCGSETFLHWYAMELSANNLYALLIPEGFAHGFQVMEENSELLYLHTHRYMPDAEYGLHPHDPRLHIEWPLPVVELSDRDQQHKLLTDTFVGIEL